MVIFHYYVNYASLPEDTQWLLMVFGHQIGIPQLEKVLPGCLGRLGSPCCGDMIATQPLHPHSIWKQNGGVLTWGGTPKSSLIHFRIEIVLGIHLFKNAPDIIYIYLMYRERVSTSQVASQACWQSLSADLAYISNLDSCGALRSHENMQKSESGRNRESLSSNSMFLW